ncbi:uncharacterized protein BT62DRAFT_927706 [Guyanagaster necrorhizus]|uniref:SLS1 C-terminal domain-containing protein n=1 Tax=Guyanagaster necrorhizus TaxID=856835 RepID=A0A9P7VZD3_9AGAR|nr:uncharacterized protein BT62DRAFT_927706 [Guyanagaster necrorhizus MCA 3950]KAG7450406.1 hypothetical protein BT62DRAFT_927706 [Guyanagaster necrorhizus MCA 3950]
MSIYRVGRALRQPLCSACILSRFHRLYTVAAVQHAAPTAASEDNTEPSSEPSPPKASKRKSTRKATKKPDVPPRKTVLEESRVHSHLASLQATEGILTLDELERHKPSGLAHPQSPKYEEQYSELQNFLLRSFNSKQLVQFIRLSGSNVPMSRDKNSLVTIILEETWNMPSLSQIQKDKKERTETGSQTYPLDRRQSFLILGKDGIDLLTLSTKYKVQMSFSSNPLSLKVSGLRVHLNQLSEHVLRFKESIRDEIYHLPTKLPIRADLLQRVSRLAGAFTENLECGTIRISYKVDQSQALIHAKRLATRASCESLSSPDRDVFVHIPPGIPSSTPVPLSMFPHTYSLYPFLSPRTVPWTSSGGGSFRIRRVGEWLGISSREDLLKSGGLAMGRGTVLTKEAEKEDIRQVLKNMAGLDETKTVTASFGHVLLNTPPLARTTLVPPLKGNWPLADILKWIREYTVPRTFSPSVPAAVLELTPSNQRTLHRLIYRQVFPPDTRANPDSARTIRFETALNVLPEEGQNGTSFSPSASIGSEESFDLMLPDRSTDIQFSVSDTRSLTMSEWPSELKGYFEALQSFILGSDDGAPQPETPLTLCHGDETYVLNFSSSVRQHNDTIPGADFQSDFTSENELDLESDQKSSVCKVVCQNVFNEASWRSFMKTCDHLSTLSFRVTPPTSTLEGSAEDLETERF